jgi:hypothetical protein
MKHFTPKLAAIHYASSDDAFGMELIKETKQFPNYYHKAKKQLLDNKCNLIFFVPSSKSGVEYGYMATIRKVSLMNDYSKLHDFWIGAELKPDDWDMLIELNDVVKISLKTMESKGIETKGIQGGIRFLPM